MKIDTKDRPLITLDNISVRLYDKIFLRNASWEIKTHENWAIVGPNGSGKTTLAKALFDGVPVVRGSVSHHVDGAEKDEYATKRFPVGYASPELFRVLFEREEMEESFRDFSGRIDEKTTLRDIILRGMARNAIAEEDFEQRLLQTAAKMGIRDILERDICAVSSGELCKVVIVRALMKKPRLLILDEPFNGLDKSSRNALMYSLEGIIQSGMRLVLITHRFEEILPGITHVLHMRDGEIVTAGKKEQVLRSVSIKNGGPVKAPAFAAPEIPVLPPFQKGIFTDTSIADGLKAQPLIDMRHVTVRYGDTVVLDDFSWRVESGENWLILGENGAGKSTILKLIMGDNPQAYSNEIFVFGRKRGVGTSIWEVKKQIGLVSTEFQAKYPKDVPAFKVVLSGFHDSLGLYRSCSMAQRNTAMGWMKSLDIDKLAERPFGRLSYGQRKMTLIARAVVKSPVMLFLDEPCDGLDEGNRRKILGVLEHIGRNTHTKLVYVTHHDDEIIPCITHRLTLHHGRMIELKKIC